MPTSLFIERRDRDLAFYLNGDLQFDTADEALYHEYLAIPTLTLARQRFPQTPLRVLICGGGDGLAAREVLRFLQVGQIDLVDYNPEVVELGKTVFQPWNQGSLESDRLTVHLQDAFEWVESMPDRTYHVVICDFTYPTCTEDTRVYSREWFASLNRILVPGGLVSTNGISPQNRTAGFWCLYQTILAAGLKVKPIQLSIPSFQEHGYGNWGFFLASGKAIEPLELETAPLPENLQFLDRPQLLEAFVFPQAIASRRGEVTLHTLACPQLFYYLLNPDRWLPHPEAADGDRINFLELEDVPAAPAATVNSLTLEATVRAWLEELHPGDRLPPSDIEVAKLLPVQHRYHSPKMTGESLNYIQQMLAEVDLSRLLASLLRRAQDLPPKVAQDLKELAEKIRTGQPLVQVSPKTAEFVTILSVTLLMANLATPDAVFAKGFYSGGGYGDDDYDGGSFFNPCKITGFMLSAAGGFWLYNLLINRDE
jgi:spermidine synthase